MLNSVRWISTIFLWTSLVFFVLIPIKAKASSESLSFIHYTNKDGLPSSYVKSLTQDQYGFIWMATRLSVCRFDGQNFREFPAYDETGTPVSLICNRIFMFDDSVLITRTILGKYFYFDFDTECFRPYHILNEIGVVQSVQPVDGGFWICRDKNLYFLDSESGLLSELRDVVDFGSIPGDVSFWDIRSTNENLVALTEKQLIIWFDFKRSKIKSFELPPQIGTLAISAFYIDDLNNVWVGEETCGLFRVNLETGKAFHYSKDETGDKRIPHNMVHCFTEDHQGRVWIGSEAGLFIWSPLTDKFTFSRYDLSNPLGLNSDPIYDAFCDKGGNVWLGTYFGGINFWNAEKSFFKTWQSGFGSRQLGGNVVSCLTEDRDGNIWIGLEDLGINKLDVSTGVITKYSSETDENGLTYNNVHDLFFLDNSLWIATYTGGINILNTSTDKFSHINRKTNPEIPSDNIYSFYRYGDTVFIATTQGLGLFNIKTGEIENFHSEELRLVQFESICKGSNKIWFSSSPALYYYDLSSRMFKQFDKVPEFTNINFVKADSKGRIWLGDCYDGLCYFDEKNEEIKYFNKSTGFPVSWIFSLEEAKDGWFWASSDKGLVRFHPEKGISILYDSNSGIPFNQFNFRASFKDSWGNIYFGGNSGMVSFNENESPDVTKKLNVYITGMQLFNKPVVPGKKTPLKKSINKVKEIRLDYNQNVFTIEYSALSYTTSGKCQYAYYLENFEDSWNYVGNREFATYTNLSPGTYYLHVKGSIGNILDESNETVLKIVVRPPFWLSIWAFILYFILVWALTIMIYLVGKRFEKSKAMVEMERREKEHADEIHQVKLEFFTNISHELKTPLTLILGPLNKILEEEKLSPLFKKRIVGVEKNAQRLYHLINQLLEFRKIEDGKEHLQIEQCDLAQLSQGIKESFEAVSENRNIEFNVFCPVQPGEVWIDINKVDKIIVNLLSNAFKFTKEGGKIELRFDFILREKKARKIKYDLVVWVTDTGKGIKPEMLDKVFDRFFHFEDQPMNEKNSGIGLAYLKSLIILHRGEITVESEIGKGSKFKVVIPISKSDYSKDEFAHSVEQYVPSPKDIAIDTETDDVNEIEDANGLSYEPVVLVVEDNLELLEFMKESLEQNYQIFTAKSGIEALEKIKIQLPDLIISDVMMPGMDGYELTHKIKSDIETSHLPVILLTAKSGVENRFKGLKSGADYYIEKPFYPAVLEQNIQNILTTRIMLIEKFKNDAFVPVSDVAHSESDKIFIEKLTNIIKANISDPTMDVTYLIKEMGMSRSLLHLKLKNLVNCSTTEFIRSIRLREAVKLISNGKYNISEAAYETGFSSPTYFTRRFKEHFGKSPRDYFDL
jgi:signal transduction histidine kinase/ligand-binding sensor domain-containing protein/AraC-like DNA-binding protein